MFQYRDFNEPRPSSFPLIASTRPEKNWKLDKYQNPDFKEALSRELAFSIDGDVDQQALSTKLAKQKMATLYSTLKAATIQKGADHLGLNVLSNIDQVNDKSNAERVKDDKYVAYNKVLQNATTQAGLAQAQFEAKKKRAHEIDQEEDQSISDDDGTVAKGYTYTHNLNLYHGAESLNPFKKADVANYQAFENNPFFHAFTKNFMSPLRALGKDVWSLANKEMGLIQKNSVSIENVSDPFRDNDLETFSIYSNYNTILSDPKIWRSWQPHTIFGFMIRRWSDVKSFHKTIRDFVGRSYERIEEIKTDQKVETYLQEIDMTFNDYVKEVDTKLQELEDLSVEAENAKDSVVKNAKAILTSERNDTAGPMATEEEVLELKQEIEDMLKIFDESSISQDQKNQIMDLEGKLPDIIANIPNQDLLTEEYLEKPKQWWEQIAKNVPSVGMLLPFGLLAEAAQGTAKEMDFGNWEDSISSDLAASITDDEGGFMDTMFSGYTSYIDTTYLGAFKGQGTVSAESFAIDNLDYGQSILKTLQRKGFVDQNGRVTTKFDPNSLEQSLEISSDDNEINRIRGILRTAVSGSLNIDQLDTVASGGFERNNIRLTDAEGDSLTLREVAELIGKGETLKEKYTNTRKAYNIFFDMVSSMMGTGIDGSPVDGTPKITKKDEVYELSVYPKSSWFEYNDKKAIVEDKNGIEQWIGGWESVSEKPLSIQFKNEEDAKQFFEEMKSMVALLEPALGTFDPTADVGPGQFSKVYNSNGEIIDSALRVLIDNQGMLNGDQVVSLGDDGYQVHVDTIFHAPFFNTNQWQTTSKFLSNETMTTVGKEMFKKSIRNRFERMRHRRKKREYAERKKEHEDREYERMKSEMKLYQKRLKEKKEVRRKHLKHVQKLQAEIKKQAKIHQMKEEKRLKEMKAASKAAAAKKKQKK